VRVLATAYRFIIQVLAPAEGEEWLVGLVVALLVLGAARHRLEPWLAGVAVDPPVEVADAVDSARGPVAAVAPAVPPAVPPAVARAVADIDLESFGRVDLNRATAAELETLPRIGPALAARIVADRSARGSFARIEDLDRVKGIGPAILAALADEVVAGPPPDRAADPAAEGDSTRPGAPAPALPADSSSARARAE
jgi:competence ComEA-like helix-hairpin-helix protein